MIIKQNPVLREAAHALIPLIFLYAFYVQFHGDFGPGGGFQAGVIFTVGLVIYGLVYGLKQLQQIISRRTAEILACIGVLLYCSVGFISWAISGNFLDYDALAAQPLSGQHLGILLVELGVSITIVGTLLGIFFLLADDNT